MFAKIMRWFRRADHATPVMDHIEVDRPGNVAARKLARARKIAAERHGKKFHADVIHQRETPPSRVLEELQQASNKSVSDERKQNVKAIR